MENDGEKNVLIIGAGASGRGHVAQLAAESGYHVTFVDTDRRLVELLRARGSYDVRLVSAHTRTFTLRDFSIFGPEETEAVYRAFVGADLIFTAVCPENLPGAADEMRPHFIRWLTHGGGKPKNVLCCENMNHSTTAFRGFLEKGFPVDLVPGLESLVGFADTMIARVVARPRDPLSLLGEEYSEWTADRNAIRGDSLPVVKTLELVENQDRYLQRKLYIHNTGHATFGYLGFLKGYTYVHEAAQDPDIMAVCRKAIEESGWAIEKEHGFSAEVIRHYRDALTDKCVLPELPDELSRVVRDPVRKLGPEERFFGPIGLLLRHGRRPDHLLFGVAAALMVPIEGDAPSRALRDALTQGGVSAALELCGTRVPADVLGDIERIMAVVRERFGHPAGSRA
jgi:mannitol-1-phosphate 5-dehydrogenase